MAKDNAVAIPNLIDDEDQLRDIVDFDSAMRALEVNGIAVEDLSDYGTGFQPIDKSQLVGVPFVVLGFRQVTGTFGPMAVLFVVTEQNMKGIIVDGSTGIAEQLFGNPEKGTEGYVGRGISSSFLVRRGLTRSDYTYKDEKGNDIPATTYYLSE